LLSALRHRTLTDLETWFRTQLELQRRFKMNRGCPFGTIGNEITENDELVRQDLSLIFEVIRNKIASFFIREKANGRLVGEANEDSMADFCIAVIQGAMLLGRVRRNSRPVETTIHEALAHVKRYATTPKR
jgi:TetR/AcrR family transcriptional regulator, transcriptional repressor for nem operon